MHDDVATRRPYELGNSSHARVSCSGLPATTIDPSEKGFSSTCADEQAAIPVPTEEQFG
jgi:hypothetical protein